MTRYPEVLLPRRTYPMLENEDVRDNTLARETTVNKDRLCDSNSPFTRQGHHLAQQSR
jgi:hypothetical protein